jgi:serine-type D-Ala-D-Ala carboxypeptidase (penicillin-binding protein 5/6)
MKKVLFLILSVFLFFIVIPVDALNVNSKNIVLYNLDTHERVFGYKDTDKVSIASLTKIMSAVVALENIDDLDKEVTITEDMLKGLKEKNAYVVGLKVGQKVSYRELLYACIVASGADATNAIAISVSGSVDSFVVLMNKKAKELELNNTSFANPMGLDDKNNYSTVNEVAELLMYALKNDTFKEIFTTDVYVFKDKSITVKSSMREGGKNAGVDTSMILGAKTGYDTDAGRCLASIAYDKKNDVNYLLVTTGADDDYNKMYNIKDAYELYTYFFTNYSYHILVEKNADILNIDTKYLKDDFVTFKSNEEIKLLYNNKDFDKNNIKLSYTGIKQIKPFTKKGEKLGVLDVYYKDKLIKSIDIVLDNKPSISIIKVIKGEWFTILSVLIFVFSLVVFIFTIKKYLKVIRRV